MRPSTPKRGITSWRPDMKRQGLWMLPTETQQLIQKMTNEQYKELRGRFKGLLRTEALAPGTHAAIKGEVENILAQE